jgi:hypothetical protein
VLNDVYRIRVELICRSGVGSVSMDRDVNSVYRSDFVLWEMKWISKAEIKWINKLQQ